MTASPLEWSEAGSAKGCWLESEPEWVALRAKCGGSSLRSDGMKRGVPSWYVLEAQIFHPEEDTP
jgi:hypothetical protein